MATFSDCPGCSQGNHDQHVHHWGKRPEGVIDGDFCACQGDCEPPEWIKRLGDASSIDLEPASLLSPEAQRLHSDLHSIDPVRSQAAIRRLNRLMEEDPL